MDSHARKINVLKKWETIRRGYPWYNLCEDKQFIEPYVLSRKTYGHALDFLVVNRQGQNWYDKPDVLMDFELFNQFGMIRPGDVVFDCGAHQGYYALILSKMVGERGKVYSFEPFPILTDVIECNMELNQANNVQLFKLGVSNTKGKIRGSLNEENVGVTRDKDAIDISLDVLDSFAHLKPNFVKLDVEGAEVNALEGAKRVLAQTPNLYIEIHVQYLPHFNRKAMEIFNFVDPKKYNIVICYPEQPLMFYNLEFPIERSCALYCVRKEIEFYKRTTLGTPTAMQAMADLIRKQQEASMEVAAKLARARQAEAAPVKTVPTSVANNPKEMLRRLAAKLWG